MLTILGFAMIGASRASSLSAPFALKRAVDALARGDPGGLTWIAAFAALRASGQVLNNGKNVVLCWISRPLGRELAHQLFQRLLSTDFQFHTRRNTGALLRCLERSPRAVDTLLRSVLFTFAPVCCELFFVLGLLRMQGVEVVVVVLLSFVSYFLFTGLVSFGWIAAARRRMNFWDDNQSAKATEALLNIEQVKLLGGVRREAEAFNNAQLGLQLASQSSDAAASFMNGGQQVITTTGLGLCLWFIARKVLQGSASVGDIFMAQGLVMSLWAPLQFLGLYIREARQAAVDLEGARQLLIRETLLKEPLKSSPLPPAGGTTPVVEFDNVSFKYEDSDRMVLEDVSFEVLAGERVVMFGASGSGKSSIARLVPRLNDASKGSVRFNGVDVRNLHFADLRTRIAVVPQDVIVFNATIRQNLLYAKPDASEAELTEVLRSSQLESAVAAMPLGLETVTGERGLCLSGGERQRLAIARALLRSPELLILDEATSALDLEAERRVLEVLATSRNQPAILCITHKLTKYWVPDKTLILADGRVRQE